MANARLSPWTRNLRRLLATGLVAGVALIACVAQATKENMVRAAYFVQNAQSKGTDLIVTASGPGATEGSTVKVTTDQGTKLTLNAGALSRRVSVPVSLGTGELKDVVTLYVDLKTASGETFCAGTSVLLIAYGQYDAAFIGGESNCAAIQGVRAVPTAKAGVYYIVFTAEGDAASKIGSGTLRAVSVSRDEKVFASDTSISADDFDDVRSYVTVVNFDGDAVGYAYDLDIVLEQGGTPLAEGKISVPLVELPGVRSPGGPQYRPAANGAGTRRASSQASIKPGLK